MAAEAGYKKEPSGQEPAGGSQALVLSAGANLQNACFKNLIHTEKLCM